MHSCLFIRFLRLWFGWGHTIKSSTGATAVATAHTNSKNDSSPNDWPGTSSSLTPLNDYILRIDSCSDMRDGRLGPDLSTIRAHFMFKEIEKRADGPCPELPECSKPENRPYTMWCPVSHWMNFPWEMLKKTGLVPISATGRSLNNRKWSVCHSLVGDFEDVVDKFYII